MAFPKTIAYGTLKERNPQYKGEFWAKCRALYAGGHSLLENQELLKKVMPKHNREDDAVYKERLSRAFYIPYAGSIIDKIVSELTNKPITVEKEEDKLTEVEGKEKKEDVTPIGEDPLDPFYEAFFKDCSKPGGLKMSINQLAREQILQALQCKVAWTLVDLPPAPGEGEKPYANRAEQDAAGALDAYACVIDPECVIDWEEDESGELTFVVIMETLARRTDITGNRDMVTIRFRIYNVTEWAVYELTYDKKKKPQGPSDKEPCTLKASGKHSFKRVPVRRMCLADGLWAMGKLEAMARAHLNQRNALSWGQLKTLFPMPILYAQAPNPMDSVTEDAGRAAQRSGPGNLWVLSGGGKDSGPGDRMEYFSPDPAPFTVAAADLNTLRDEMHRVLHHMAMSVDNSGAAMQRSGESKQVDQAAASVILRALGTIVREHVEDVYETVAAGRNDSTLFSCKGMDSFDDVTVTDMVNDAMTLETVSIPSATFQKKHKLKVAKIVLGGDATEDEIKTIAEELDKSITQDTFDMEQEATALGHEATAKEAERTVKGELGPEAKANIALKKQAIKAKPKKKSAKK